jgi:hypothetical protein
VRAHQISGEYGKARTRAKEAAELAAAIGWAEGAKQAASAGEKVV